MQGRQRLRSFFQGGLSLPTTTTFRAALQIAFCLLFIGPNKSVAKLTRFNDLPLELTDFIGDAVDTAVARAASGCLRA